MNTSASNSTLALLLATALVIAIGSISYVAFAVMEIEVKWFVYLFGALAGGLIFVNLKDKERFLWVAFLVSFQFDVYLRFFHGYAGSPGLMFGMPFLAALVLIIWHLLPLTSSTVSNTSLGGPLILPVAALLAVSVVSALLSDEQFFGFHALLNLAQYLTIFLVVLNYIDTREKLELTIKVLLVVLTIQAIVYFIQVSLGITFTLTGEIIDAGGRSSSAARPGGTVATNPAGYASFVLPLLCLAAAFFAWLPLHAGSFLRVGMPLFLGIAALVLTLTRAAWGSMVIGLAAVFWMSMNYKRLSTTKLTLICLAGVIGIAAAIPLVMARLDDAPLSGSYDERFYLMQMAFEMIKAEPLLGVGPFAYRPSLASYLPYELWDAWRATVHNHYLLRTAETGIVGGISFVAILLTIARQAKRVSAYSDPFLSTVGIGVFGAILALAFEMFWDIFGGYSYNALMWMVFGLIGAIELHKKQLLAPETTRKPDSGTR